MNSIVIIFGFCLVLPLTHVSGAGDIESSKKRHGDQVESILRMAESGEPINGVLKLLENSFLGWGSGGMVFRGLRIKDNKPVAIKFISKKKSAKAKREYEMFSYLHAINNTSVENYGIPALYYCGEWKNFTVTAFTELEETLAQRTKFMSQQNISFDNHDILLLLRQFVKQTKYIHSLGVRHDDIKPENIMIRKCESFLIDFDLASKMNEDYGGGTPLLASLKYHQRVKRVPLDDWESFLYTVYNLLNIKPRWFKFHLPYETIEEKETASEKYSRRKSDRTKILQKIYKSLEQSPFKDVLIAFAREAFSSKLIPDYDELDARLSGVLKNYYPENKCFSWVEKSISDGTVTDSERSDIEESIERANTDIKKLKIPKNFKKYGSFNYPIADEDFFNKESESWCKLQ